MLALGVSLGLIVCGGTASALALHLGGTSPHTALPTDGGPTAGGPTDIGPSEIGPTETGAPGSTQAPGDCIAAPNSCGFPDGTNTGVPGGTVLLSVPGQVSSGPGWYYNPTGHDVIVDADGTVLSGLYIPYDLVINASNVTVRDVRVVTGGYFGISLTHTTGVTIEDATISGQNATTGRVGSAIDDVYGDSTGIVIKDNNIFQFKTGVQISTGLIADNYIHDPGYVKGDHTNGIFADGTTKPLTIYGNTVFNDLGQTDDISLDASSSGKDVANKFVVDNLLAGGAYCIYGGDARNGRTSNIVIEDNEFGRLYYPDGGQYGPAAYVDLQQAGNVWSGNVWSGTSDPAMVG